MPDYAEFIQKYPSYDKTHDLDELREREYARLARTGQVYLDYTGGGLYADLQVRQHQKLLARRFLATRIHPTRPRWPPPA